MDSSLPHDIYSHFHNKTCGIYFKLLLMLFQVNIILVTIIRLRLIRRLCPYACISCAKHVLTVINAKLLI